MGEELLNESQVVPNGIGGNDEVTDRSTPSSPPRFDPLIFSRDDIRREALHVQRAHDPAQQADNGYDRCALCHYTRHPCDAYDMATTVLALIDQGQPDEYFT